ncbi:MAG: MFS transporter [Hyphomicrobiaceae bacterium]|nr:MFS transporter [Hyphomicrobiaceae bacterium]
MPKNLSSRHRIVVVLLPFAAGYFLSYIYRSINAVIAGPLATDMGLKPADLGVLTSMYFMAMVIVQIPVGTLLDRYGPRRVQACLFPVSAVGACLFAVSDDLLGLGLGRLLIGFGVATALMAGVKAAVLWFPPERLGFANGVIVFAGALGAVVATAPAEALVDAWGWRRVFLVLAALTMVIAIIIASVVPERPKAATHQSSTSAITLRAIYANAKFWRIAPMSATCIGTSWALQGLWAAPWLRDVDGFDQATVVRHLFVMAMALCLSAMVLGALADGLRRRGVATERLFGMTAALFMLAQLAVILRWPIPAYIAWGLIAMAGAATVLSYAILPGYFPKEASGRANAALNMLHLGTAFTVQTLVGFVIQAWPTINGRPPDVAYQTAFGVVLAAQTIAIMWFVVSSIGARWPRIRRRLPNVLNAYQPMATTCPYRHAHLAWLFEVRAARQQVTNWRTAAFASLAVCLTLTTLTVPSLVLVRSEAHAEGIGYLPQITAGYDSKANQVVALQTPAMTQSLTHHKHDPAPATELKVVITYDQMRLPPALLHNELDRAQR